MTVPKASAMPRKLVVALGLGGFLTGAQIVVMGIYRHAALVDFVDICSGTLDLFYYVPISAAAFLFGVPLALWSCYEVVRTNRRSWPLCIVAIVLNLLPLYIPSYVMDYVNRARHLDYAKDCR